MMSSFYFCWAAKKNNKNTAWHPTLQLADCVCVQRVWIMPSYMCEPCWPTSRLSLWSVKCMISVSDAASVDRTKQKRSTKQVIQQPAQCPAAARRSAGAPWLTAEEKKHTLPGVVHDVLHYLVQDFLKQSCADPDVFDGLSRERLRGAAGGGRALSPQGLVAHALRPPAGKQRHKQLYNELFRLWDVFTPSALSLSLSIHLQTLTCCISDITSSFFSSVDTNCVGVWTLLSSQTVLCCRNEAPTHI